MLNLRIPILKVIADKNSSCLRTFEDAYSKKLTFQGVKLKIVSENAEVLIKGTRI